MDKHDSKVVARAMVMNWRRKAKEEMRKTCKEQERKRALRLTKIICLGLIASTQACSLADPAAGGNSSGADAYLYSVPEAGSVSRTVTITRTPTGDPTATGGQMYNRRSFSDWLYGRGQVEQFDK